MVTKLGTYLQLGAYWENHQIRFLEIWDISYLYIYTVSIWYFFNKYIVVYPLYIKVFFNRDDELIPMLTDFS